jgi:hypothetical protein
MLRGCDADPPTATPEADEQLGTIDHAVVPRATTGAGTHRKAEVLRPEGPRTIWNQTGTSAVQDEDG